MSRYPHLAGIAIGLMWHGAPVHAADVMADGFGDGDRDNDGRRVEQIEDRRDVGGAWYMLRGTSDFLLSIADDSAGIGAGNALGVSVTRDTSRSVGAGFAEVALSRPGDVITLSFDVRVLDNLDGVEHDRKFRFGLYHDGGTPVAEDTAASTVTEDDLGYFVQIDVGSSADGTTVDLRGNHNGMLLGGSYNQSFGGKSKDPEAALTDQAKRSIQLTIERVADDNRTPEPNDYQFELVIDGVARITRRLSQGDQDAVVEAFNAVYFGTSNIELAYRLDNVRVSAEVAGPEPASR